MRDVPPKTAIQIFLSRTKKILLLIQARAQVRISTASAPPLFKIRAHSFTVAPVVKMSSIRQILLPATVSPGFIAKAPCRFLLRSLPLSRVWASVFLTLISRAGSIFSDSSEKIVLASTNAWFNPRLRRRERWSGTGTITPGALLPATNPVCLIRLPRVDAAPESEAYLSRCSRFRTGPW